MSQRNCGNDLCLLIIWILSPYVGTFEQCMALFREVSSEVACQLDYQYPLYDEKISNYVIRQKKKYGIEDDNK
mgnify:CR=1 FL=1